MNQVQQINQKYEHNSNQHYMVESNKQLKCICQLCTCKKHQCPRRPLKADFSTSYSRQFQKFDQQTPSVFRQPYRYEERHYAPQVLQTKYQEQFQKKQNLVMQPQLSQSRLQQMGRRILAPQVPFMGVSSYKDQYQPYKMKKTQNYQNPETENYPTSKSPNYQQKYGVKFQGISSYKSSFIPPPQIKKPSPFVINRYIKPQVPFYGSSSYKDQYQPITMSAQKYEFFDETVSKNVPKVKFQGKSAYKQQYLPYDHMENSNQNISRVTKKGPQCRFDQIRVPGLNYINNKEHLYFDTQKNSFH